MCHLTILLCLYVGAYKGPCEALTRTSHCKVKFSFIGITM